MMEGVHAQRDFGTYKQKNIALGYIYSSWDSTENNFHLLELEYWSSGYFLGPHYGAITRYAGVELGLNAERFTVGPKFGVQLNYSTLIFGIEAVVYTDFDQATMRLAPVFGLGNHNVSLTLSPQIKLINGSFSPIHQGQINIAGRIALIQRKKLGKGGENG